MKESSRHQTSAQAVFAEASGEVWSLARRLAFGVALLSISAFISACGGCGGDNNDTPDACEGVTCERGVCSAENDGVCVNADDCSADANLCLEGFECRDGSCQTDYPCNDVDNPCDRGTCQVGACVNTESCSIEADCLPGYVCDGGACVEDPCESGEVTCDRGVCSSDEAACVNKEVCAAASEGEDCLEGYKCYAQSCVNNDEFCAAIDCQRGICSFDEKACVSAPDCSDENGDPDDGLCLAGEYCNADNTCVANECEIGSVMCPRGECDRDSGECVNPGACDASQDCLPMFLCVDNVCTPEAEACGVEGCPGNQVCFHEEITLEASCIEDVNSGCTNAFDCVDDRICVNGACSPPPACEPDAYEMNNDEMSATLFQDVAPLGFVNVNLCSNDVDVYTYDTERDIDGIGKLVVQLDYAPEDIGLGILKAEILSPNGMVVAQGEAVDGRLDLNTDVTIVNKGVYTVRVSPGASGVTTAGVRYRLSIDVVDTTAIDACDIADTDAPLAADTMVMSNTVSGNSAALASTCADPDGLVAEDIYRIEVPTASYVTITATPSDMASDISVSLRSNCLRNTSQVPGSCSEQGGAGVEESSNALLSPGTYYIVVQGPAEGAGGSYSLVWSRQDVVCTSADNGCQDANTAQVCRPDGTGFDTENCLQGCNMMQGACNRLDGDLCSTATTVDPVTGYTGMIPWGSYRSDYDPGVGGCVITSDAGQTPTDGPDVTYSVTLQPNQGVVVDLTSNGNDVSLYAVTDCFDVTSTCQVGANANDAASNNDEFLFYANQGATAETILLVADVAASADGTYTDSAITISVNDIICTPGEVSCSAADESQQCDPTGTGYDVLEACQFGCDANSGLCLTPPNDTCSGAIALTSGVPAMAELGDYSNTDELSSSDCTGFSTPGGDAIYTIAVQENDIVDVLLTAPFDGAVWVATTCDPANDTLVGSCIGGADENFTGGDEQVQVVAPFTGDLYVVATSFSASGSGVFSLTATVTTPECTRGQPATCSSGTTLEYCDNIGFLQNYTCSTTCTNGACDDPIGDICPDPKVLDPLGGSIVGDTFGGTNSIEFPEGVSGNCYVGSFDETDGDENIYSIDLAAGDLFSLDVDSPETTINAFVLENCYELDSCQKNFLSEGPNSLEFYAQTAGTYFVVIDTSDSSSSDPYDLTWSVTSGLVCAPGQTYCQDATTMAKCDDAGSSALFTTTCANGCQAGYCLPDLTTTDTCSAASMATDVGQGISAVFSYDDLTNDVEMQTPNCVGQLTDGPDAFYKVTLQPTEILQASVISIYEFDDPQVYAFTDCADPVGTCVAGAPELGGDNTSEIQWANDTGAPVTLIVAADNESSFADEPFIFNIAVRTPECVPGERTCQPTPGINDQLRLCNDVGLYDIYTCDGACGTNAPGTCDSPSGEICFDPIPLRDPAQPGATSGEFVDQSFLTGDDVTLLEGRTGSCNIDSSDQSDGPDTFYTISLAAGDVLTADLITTETTAYVMILEDCSADSCVANNVNPGAASVTYYADAPRDVFVVVDSTTTTSLDPYTLRWNVQSGLACAPGQFRCLNATTLGACSNDGLTETSVTCPGACDGNTCVADPLTGDTCTAASAAPAVTGSYSTYASYDDLTDDIDMPSSSCAGQQTDGPDLFVPVEVQAGQILSARVESFGDEPPIVFMVTDCAAPETSCVAGGEELGTSNVATATWVNDTGAPATVLVAADNEFSTADEPFGLFISLRSPECTPGARQCVPNSSTLQICNEFGLYDNYTCNGGCGNLNQGRCDNPTGDVCADAFAMTYPSGSVVDAAFEGSNSFELGQGATGGCFIDDFDENDGPDTHYSIDLQAGDVLDVTLTTAHTAAHLFLSEGCSPTSCVDNLWQQGSGTLSYYAPQATTVYVAVDTDFTSAVSEPYTLEWNVRTGLACVPGESRCTGPNMLGVCSNDGSSESMVTCPGACEGKACVADAVANDICATVAAGPDIGAGISVSSNFDLLTNDVQMATPNCTGQITDGPDLFYKVTVQPGEVLVASLESYGDEDPLLYAIEDCAAAEATCLAGAQEVGSSNYNEILWANDTGMPKSLIVGADSELSTANEVFGLSIAVRPPECTPGQQECGGDSLKLCNEFSLFDIYQCDGGCGNLQPGRCDNPTGDVCIDALTLTYPSGSIVDSQFEGNNTYQLPEGRTGGCFIDSFDENDGPDTFYRIDLQANDVVDVKLTTNHPEAYLFLLEGCGAAADCRDNLWQQGSGTLTYYAPQATSLLVAVDTDDASPSDTDLYTLEWSVRTGLNCAPSGYRCLDATTLGICSPDGAVETPVTCSVGCEAGGCIEDAMANDDCSLVAGGTDIGAGIAVYTTFDGRTDSVDMPTPNCTGQVTDGPDFFYKVNVPAGNVLHAYVESYGDEDPLVYGITDCNTPDATCVGGGQEFGSTNRSEFYWVNDTGLAATIIVGADSESTTADEPVGLFIENLQPQCTAGAVNCNAGQLEICNQFGLYDYYACDGGQCNATNDACLNPRGDVCADAVTLIDANGVGGPSGSVTGDFTGTNTVVFPSGRSAACHVDSFDESDDADTFYRVELKANDVLRAQLVTGNSGAHIYLTTTCGDASTCLANDFNLGGGTISYFTSVDQTVFIGIDSSVASTADYTLNYEVTNGLACAPNQFTCKDAMNLSKCSADGLTETVVPCNCVDGACVDDVANNDTCAAAVAAPLVGDAYAMFGTFDDHTDDIQMATPNCTNNLTDGPDAFVRVELAPNEILHAWVDSFGDEGPLVYAFSDCADAENSCVAGASESGSTDRAELYHVNNTGAPLTLFVAADSTFSTADEPFGLFVEKLQPQCVANTSQCGADGSTLEICNEFGVYEYYTCNGACDPQTGFCANPTGDICLDTIKVNDVAAGTTMTPQTYSYTGILFSSLTNSQTLDNANGCTSFDGANGPDAIFQVTLLPNQTVDVSQTSLNEDSVVYILTDCGDGGASCVDGGDDTFTGGTETATYTNTTGMNQTVFVVADAYFTTATDAFDIDITVR